MNVLFAHDHIFYKYKDNYYSNGGLSRDVLLRYTNVFGKATLITRQKEIMDYDSNLTLASTKNIDFIDIPNFKSASKFKNIHNAKKIIEENVKQCDYLIARLPSSIGKIAVKYAKKYNKPYVVEVVGCAWDANWNYGSTIGKLIAPYEFFSNKNAILDSKYTIYITKFFLQSRYPSKGQVAVCPNVNIKPVDNIILEKRKKKINKNLQPIKFGLIGSLDVNYKGHEIVIKALGMLKKRNIDFKIEFLGKGDLNRWKNLIAKNNLQENVDFIGTLPSGDQVYKWIDTIDVMLQPSKAEAQGRSIIEAMSRGCTIIASKVGGIVELIEDEWLINSGDYIDLYNKITRLVKSKEQMLNQATKNFDESKYYYSRRIESTRIEFLNKLINESVF